MVTKYLLVLLSAKLVFSQLDPKTSCCLKVYSGNNIPSVDPFGPGKPYVMVRSGYEQFGAPQIVGTTDAVSGMPNPEWNQEFCGGGPEQNDKLRYIDTEYFQFEVYSKMTDGSPDKLIGRTEPKSLIRDSECCDRRDQNLRLDNGGTLKVAIACDYTCQVESRSFSNDVKPCNGFDSAQKEPNKEDKFDRSSVEVIARAEFTSRESEIDGYVEVDSNGNIIIDLDLPKLDRSDCSELEFGIFNRYDYNVPSNQDCEVSKLGEVFNPFGKDMCDNVRKGRDMYFECAIGDLSGRCGTIEVDRKRTNVNLECNVSENSNDKEGGFCKARLTPEVLDGKSIVFSCKDGKNINRRKLACAGFEVTNNYRK